MPKPFSREPVIEATDLDRFQKYQLYGTDILQKIKNKSQNSFNSANKSDFLNDPSNALEPVGETAVVSFNNGFIYEDVRSIHQENFAANTSHFEQKKHKKKTKFKSSLENLV